MSELDIDLVFALSDRDEARRYLVAYFEHQREHMEADMAARPEIYETAIQAALPTMPAEQVHRLAQFWECAKAYRKTVTDAERDDIQARIDQLDDGLNDWFEPVLAAFYDNITDDPLSDDDLLKLAELAGPVEEWLP